MQYQREQPTTLLRQAVASSAIRATDAPCRQPWQSRMFQMTTLHPLCACAARREPEQAARAAKTYDRSAAAPLERRARSIGALDAVIGLSMALFTGPATARGQRWSCNGTQACSATKLYRMSSAPPEDAARRVLCGEGDELRWIFQSLVDVEGLTQCPHHVSSSILSSLSLLSILRGGHQSEYAVLLFFVLPCVVLCFPCYDFQAQIAS